MKFKTFTKALILSIFIFETIKFYSFYVEYSSWQYGDWLINYQGGFIRRGLIGEIFFQAHKFTSIHLDKIIFSSVIVFYFLFSLLLIKSIKYFEKSKLDYFLFLSPGFFLYPVMNSEIIGRKDIILVLVVGVFVFFNNIFKKNLNFILLIFFIILLTFSHSAFLFYTQYLMAIYFFSQYKTFKSFENWKLVVYIFLIIILALLLNKFQGNQFQVEQICQSVKNYSPNNCENTGQIGWLINNMSSYLGEKIEIGFANIINYIIIYSIAFYLFFIFLIKKLNNSKFTITFKNSKFIKPLTLFLFLILLSLPTFILARDWGRYIHLNYSCSILLYIYLVKNHLIVSNKINLPKIFNKKYIFIFIIFAYSFFWTVPFYDAKFIKFTLAKPIINLID